MSSFRLSALRQDQIARSVVLATLLAATGLMCLHMAYITDADIWWQMRAGEWILQHHAFPQTDTFSIHGMGKPWEAYSWLFDLIVLKLYQHWDLVGLVIYSTALVMAITASLYNLLRRLQPDGTTVVLLTMAAMACLTRLFTPRPWLITIFFFVLELDILLQARKTGKMRGLVWLPVLFAFWANIHVQFIDGLIVLGVAVWEPLLERWWPHRQTRLSSGKLWAIFGACILGTMLNPYGWRIYQIAYELASQHGVLSHVAEMEPLPFRQFEDFLFLFLVLAAAGALGWSRRFPVFETALLAMGAIVSFRSERDIWFIVIIASAILASSLPGKREQPAGLPVVALPLILLVACAVLSVGAVAFQVNNAELHKRLAEAMPVRAVEVVKERGYHGPLFNDYNWGGFLIWHLREPVSIDGRAALQGDELIERTGNTWNAQPGWSSDPDLSAAGLVIAPVKAPLVQLLRGDPQFDLAFEDKLVAVFVRRAVQGQVLNPPRAAASGSAGAPKPRF